jgi:hypothetical protein
VVVVIDLDVVRMIEEARAAALADLVVEGTVIVAAIIDTAIIVEMVAK